MKLLAICLNDHDMNMSYYDGEKLQYYKAERNFGISKIKTYKSFSTSFFRDTNLE